MLRHLVLLAAALTGGCSYVLDFKTGATCGDGLLDLGEGCDDGNTVDDGNGCSATCTRVGSCGDGTRQSYFEACDDGAAENGVTDCAYGAASCWRCSTDCKTRLAGVPRFCGDGLTSLPETCDDHNATTEYCDYPMTTCNVCGSTCQTVAGRRCGDTVVDIVDGEECDTGGDTPMCKSCLLTGGYTAVTAAPSRACGLTTTGGARCWGALFWAQPMATSGLVALAAGPNFTCGLRADHTVQCWGNTSAGIETTAPSGTFDSIAAGHSHVCGIRPGGAVECWGDDTYGQKTPPAGTFKQLATGGVRSMCGLTTANTPVCWGEPGATPSAATTFKVIDADDVGGCGIRLTDDTLECWGWFTPVPAGTFSATAVGGDRACAIAADGSGKVTCWGPAADATTAPSGAFISLAGAGTGLMCGLTTGGSIQCWGTDIGGATSPPAPPYEHVEAGSVGICAQTGTSLECWGTSSSSVIAEDFTSYSIGGRHGCGILPSGSVKCWQILLPNEFGEATAPAGTFTQVSAGATHTCGLQSNGDVSCWGSVSTTVAGPFVQVSSGDGASCGVRVGGAVSCWPADQLAAPSDLYSSVSTGWQVACGVRSNGSLKCFGKWNFIDVPPPAGNDFVEVGYGVQHACARRKDDTVACWGIGDWAPAPGMRFTSIAIGGMQSCGITASGRLVCWGNWQY